MNFVILVNIVIRFYELNYFPYFYNLNCIIV